MRKFVVMFCLLAGFLSLAQGQKTRFGKTQEKPDQAKFPLRVHVSGSQMRYSCNSFGSGQVGCNLNLYVEAVIDGKKVELWGNATIGKIHSAVLAPGDYRAEVTDEAVNSDSSVISRHYTLLLPDGSVWDCALSGISE